MHFSVAVQTSPIMCHKILIMCLNRGLESRLCNCLCMFGIDEDMMCLVFEYGYECLCSFGCRIARCVSGIVWLCDLLGSGF